MRFCPAFCFWLLCLFSTVSLHAGPAKILKVLPHYLDEQGRHSLSPSLYERDAYQALLRRIPEKRSALRFDVNWKAKRSRAGQLVLRLELRSSGKDLAQPVVLQQPVKPARFFSTWTSLPLAGADYKQFGQLMAWRATLWDGTELVAEQRSFLW